MSKFKHGDRLRFIGYNDPYSNRQGWEIGDTATVRPGEIFENWVRVTRDRDGYQAGYPEVSFEMVTGVNESLWKVGDKVQLIGYNDNYSERQGWKVGDTATITECIQENWVVVVRDHDGFRNSYPMASFKKIMPLGSYPVSLAEKHLNRYQIIMEEEGLEK